LRELIRIVDRCCNKVKLELRGQIRKQQWNLPEVKIDRRNEKAIKFYQQSLEIQHEIGDRHGEAFSLFNKALILIKCKLHRFEALEIFKQSRAICIDCLNKVENNF
jgi:tetratricopeptide (TPR) repeat protein